MTTRTSIFALAALTAVAAMAIATTPASADGRFIAPRPIFVPGQVVQNCNGNPRLGCAVHIEPAPSVPVVAACPLRARFSVRVAASMPHGVAVRVRVPGPFATPIYPRHRVY